MHLSITRRIRRYATWATYHTTISTQQNANQVPAIGACAGRSPNLGMVVGYRHTKTAIHARRWRVRHWKNWICHMPIATAHTGARSFCFLTPCLPIVPSASCSERSGPIFIGILSIKALYLLLIMEEGFLQPPCQLPCPGGHRRFQPPCSPPWPFRPPRAQGVRLSGTSRPRSADALVRLRPAETVDTASFGIGTAG